MMEDLLFVENERLGIFWMSVLGPRGWIGKSVLFKVWIGGRTWGMQELAGCLKLGMFVYLLMAEAEAQQRQTPEKERVQKGIRGDRGMLCFSAPEGPSGKRKEGWTCVVQGDH
ncbi:hypothetical protein ABZX51_005012 [Aspergillus tubingensis]